MAKQENGSSLQTLVLVLPKVEEQPGTLSLSRFPLAQVQTTGRDATYTEARNTTALSYHPKLEEVVAQAQVNDPFPAPSAITVEDPAVARYHSKGLHPDLPAVVVSAKVVFIVLTTNSAAPPPPQHMPPGWLHALLRLVTFWGPDNCLSLRRQGGCYR